MALFVLISMPITVHIVYLKRRFDMKQMIYGSRTKGEVLLRETVDGIDTVIVSYGSHPCAYVKLTDDIIRKICKRNGADPDVDGFYDFIDAYPHGGFTFFGHLPYLSDDENWAGWDYAHCDDYMDPGIPVPWKVSGKKWTTEEIFEEVKEVVSQLKESYK